MKKIKSKLLVMVIICVICISNSNAYAWQSFEDISQESTHTLLVEQGLNILINDLSMEDKQNNELMNVLSEINHYMQQLKQGSVDPDFSKSNFSLYQDHFYDPTTNTNFTSKTDLELGVLDYVYQHALYRSKEYVGWAIQYWMDGNHEKSIYNLGLAMHYFSDLCHPHHASNAIGGTRELFTKHSTFESYIEERKDSYSIQSLGGKTDSSYYIDALEKEYIADFIADECDARSLVSNNIYHNIFDPQDTDTWDESAMLSMKETQEGIARIFYRFAKELTSDQSLCIDTTDESVELSIRVATKDGSIFETYGTDNAVFFGVELSNGRLMEWELDKPFHNDHEKGDNDTYIVTLDKAKGNYIRKAYIRKERGWDTGAEDNWYPLEVEVSSDDGLLQYTKPIDRWLIGNVDIVYDVN
ncbi:MAG: zinc dependent phospholipase C family protein [Vallitalea sp.]|jgi:phospholipase C/alpha-toxin|nr:zinc dependent phospholipase C family protein [Vallitalea sp.]